MIIIYDATVIHQVGNFLVIAAVESYFTIIERCIGWPQNLWQLVTMKTPDQNCAKFMVRIYASNPTSNFGQDLLIQRPLYTRKGFQYIIPPFLMCLMTQNIFLHFTNDSTLTLLRNSLFNINKQNIFPCYKKHLKWEYEVMKKVSPILQHSMTYPSCKA